MESRREIVRRLVPFLPLLVFVVLSPWEKIYVVGVLGSLLAAVVLLSTLPVILASESARGVRWGQMGERSPVFWCWQAVSAYGVVLWMAKEALTYFGLDPHVEPVPFLVYGLSLGLGLTLWDRRRRCKGHGPRGRE